MRQAAICPHPPQAGTTPLTRGAPLLSLTRHFPRFAGELPRQEKASFAGESPREGKAGEVSRIRCKQCKAREGKKDEIDLVGHRGLLPEAVTQQCAVYKPRKKVITISRYHLFGLSY